jgi:CheY-like chemotaxis protein
MSNVGVAGKRKPKVVMDSGLGSGLPGILIVDDNDDNDDNRYTLQLLLESDGHERIASASGGNEAIALLGKEKFNLVLLDMMMPERDGFELIAELQQHQEWRRIPVIIITSRDLSREDRARLNSGVGAIMMKEAFSPAKLIERIRDLVSKSPAPEVVS